MIEVLSHTNVYELSVLQKHWIHQKWFCAGPWVLVRDTFCVAVWLQALCLLLKRQLRQGQTSPPCRCNRTEKTVLSVGRSLGSGHLAFESHPIPRVFFFLNEHLRIGPSTSQASVTLPSLHVKSTWGRIQAGVWILSTQEPDIGGYRALLSSPGTVLQAACSGWFSICSDPGLWSWSVLSSSPSHVSS